MKDLLRPVGVDSPKTISLPAILGMSEAGALRDEILAARGAMIDLDGSNVGRIGGLGLQVLLSTYATWRQDGQRLRLVQPSDALIAGLAVLGARGLDPIISRGETL